MLRRWCVPLLILGLGLVVFGSGAALAQDLADPLGQGAAEVATELSGAPVATTVKLIMVMTALSFLPAIILVMTPFTRFVIVFSLLRQALGLQSSPPNQVIIGLSFALSLLIMQPTISEVKERSLDPFLEGTMEPITALDEGLKPMRRFMFSQTRRADLQAVMEIGRMPRPASLDEVPTSAVISAYVLSELKSALVIAIKVYIPFLVLDIIVANILLGMGMMVLPPVVISLPFKLLIFVLMDGWNLLVRSMAAGFYGT
jgi:flagellar biosynthesis protein FliP